MTRGKTFGEDGGGGLQGDEKRCHLGEGERVEQPEQSESGVMLLLVVGAEVSVPVGWGA